MIKNVPALLCDLCGDAYFTPEVSREIDKIVKDFREGKLPAKPIAGWRGRAEDKGISLMEVTNFEAVPANTRTKILARSL